MSVCQLNSMEDYCVLLQSGEISPQDVLEHEQLYEKYIFLKKTISGQENALLSNDELDCLVKIIEHGLELNLAYDKTQHVKEYQAKMKDLETMIIFGEAKSRMREMNQGDSTVPIYVRDQIRYYRIIGDVAKIKELENNYKL